MVDVNWTILNGREFMAGPFARDQAKATTGYNELHDQRHGLHSEPVRDLYQYELRELCCARQRHVVFAVGSNDQVIGFMQLDYVKLHHKFRAIIDNVVVHKDWQDQGIGRSMMNVIVAAAKNDRALLKPFKIRLTNHERRQNAPFYTKYGFEVNSTTVYDLVIE